MQTKLGHHLNTFGLTSEVTDYKFMAVTTPSSVASEQIYLGTISRANLGPAGCCNGITKAYRSDKDFRVGALSELF